MANGFMNPQNQFLMTAGAHLMGQPYSPVPQSTFSGLGNAFDQGIGAYQNALILQEKQREAEEKRQAMAAAQAAKETRAAQFQQAIANLPPDRRQALANWYAVDEPGAVKALYDLSMPAEVDNKMGDSAMDSAILSLGLDQKPRNQWTPADVQAVSTEADRIRRLNSPPPAAPPSEYTKMLVGLDDTYVKALDTEAQWAATKLEQLNSMASLSKLIPEVGSPAAPVVAKLQSVLQEYGLAPIDPNNPLAAKEAIEAIQMQLVKEDRKSGPRDSQFSNKDMELILKANPGLANSPDGRELMIAMLSAKAEAALDRSDSFYGSIEDYVDSGMSREEAVQRAVNDSRKARMSSARSKDGFLVKNDGSLTEWGQKIAQMAGLQNASATSGRSASGNTISNLPVMSEQEAAGLKTYNSTAEGDASGDAMYIVDGVVYQR